MRIRLPFLLLAASVAASCAAEAAAPPAPPTEAAAGASGDVRLEATADRTAITVGDPITVTVRLIHPQGTKVVSFEPARALEAVTLLDQRSGPGRPLDLGRVEEV